MSTYTHTHYITDTTLQGESCEYILSTLARMYIGMYYPAAALWFKVDDILLEYLMDRNLQRLFGG